MDSAIASATGRQLQVVNQSESEVGVTDMEFIRRNLPMEWGERWRKEKERRQRLIEEEGIEQDNRHLRWIVACNDSRMGLLSSSRGKEEETAVRMSSMQGAMRHTSEETFEEKERGDRIHVCHSQTSSKQTFKALKELWDSSLLTDLTLTTDDGKSFHVHSVVLASISSFILEKLGEANGEEAQGDTDVEALGWSVSLGPEVDHVGVQAIVEFAYTGVVVSLDGNNMVHVKAAAQRLGVSRVLDLCLKEERMTKTEEMQISAAEEMKITLKSVEQLWADRVGCDVILDVDGTLFHVHKVILAANSDYFRGMFTCGMKESHQVCVSLPFLLASELEALIDYSYGGNLLLNWNCVFEITCTAMQLQFQPALSLCLDFMRQKMDARSCLDIASFAEAYGMPTLLEEANDFVLRNFWEVSSTEKFQDLPAEKLMDFLHSDGLCVPSELAVFRAVISWIEADLEKRLDQAGHLMTAVRFPLMTFREFREVRAINLRLECFGNKSVELYGSALQEFGFSSSQTEDQWRIRRPKDALVLVGGDQLNQDTGQRAPSRELWFANTLRSGTGLVKEIEWRSLGEMPDMPRFRHGVAAMGGSLYVFGGCHFYAKYDIMKSAYRYDPAQNSWKRLADMHELRSNFSVAAHGGRFYAIGGDKEINTNVDSVEMYDPDSDSWSFVKPLDQTLSGFAATAVDGGIFISGGFDCKYACLVSLFLYHPERGTTYLADMAHDRAQHCMEALRGHLYVSGGVSNLRTFYTDQQACEVYDPATDSWTAFASLPVAHVGAASAVLEEKIYVLGGYCQEDYRESVLVHRFDSSTQRWQTMGKLPSAVTDIRACLLRLPEHFRN